MKKVLLVSYGGGHIQIISLIAEALKKSADIDFKILALTTAYQRSFNDFPKNTVGLVDYASLFKKNEREIIEHGQALLDENHDSNSSVSQLETIWYMGLSMYDLCQKIGYERAQSLYASSKRHAFLPVETMEAILKHEKPDVVVATTSPRFEQAALIAGNQLGIATLQILDLFGELHPLPEAKHIVCMNQSVSNCLKRQGLTDRHYYHYGQPAIEASVEKINALDIGKIKSKLDLNSHIVLLYATQRPVIFNSDFSYQSFAGYKTINDNVFSILEKLQRDFSVNVLLRIHPNERIEDYQPWLDRYDFIRPIHDLLNSHESIAICDVLLTPASTLGIEAVAVNKTVFTFNYHLNKYYPLPEATKKPFIFSDGFEDLATNLFGFFSGNQSRECDVKSNVPFLPTGSVKNIVQLIKRI